MRIPFIYVLEQYPYPDTITTYQHPHIHIADEQKEGYIPNKTLFRNHKHFKENLESLSQHQDLLFLLTELFKHLAHIAPPLRIALNIRMSELKDKQSFSPRCKRANIKGQLSEELSSFDWLTVIFDIDHTDLSPIATAHLLTVFPNTTIEKDKHSDSFAELEIVQKIFKHTVLLKKVKNGTPVYELSKLKPHQHNEPNPFKFSLKINSQSSKQFIGEQFIMSSLNLPSHRDLSNTVLEHITQQDSLRFLHLPRERNSLEKQRKELFQLKQGLKKQILSEAEITFLKKKNAPHIISFFQNLLLDENSFDTADREARQLLHKQKDIPLQELICERSKDIMALAALIEDLNQLITNNKDAQKKYRALKKAYAYDTLDHSTIYQIQQSSLAEEFNSYKEKEKLSAEKTFSLICLSSIVFSKTKKMMQLLSSCFLPLRTSSGWSTQSRIYKLT